MTEDKNKISLLEDRLKIAFNEKRFAEVKTLAFQIQGLDPENHIASHLVEKTERAEKEANKKSHLDEIKTLENRLRQAFDSNQFEQVSEIAGQLKALDSDSKLARRIFEKMEDAKKKAAREAQSKIIKQQEVAVEQDFSEGRFDIAEEKIATLLSQDVRNRVAKKYQKKLEKAKKALLKSAKNEEGEKKPTFGILYKVIEWLKVHFMKKLPKSPQVSSLKRQDENQKVTDELMKQANDLSMAKEKLNPNQAVVDQPVAEFQPTTQGAQIEIEPKEAIETKTEWDEPKKNVNPMNESYGNAFTRLFGKKETIDKKNSKKSIIDTIVSKTSIPEKESVKKSETKEKKDDLGRGMLHLSKAFLRFSLAFMVFSAVFFYAQNIDINNRILGTFGIEKNNAIQLHNAYESLQEQKTLAEEINQEISRYEDGYNNEYEATVKNIVENRVNWADILERINKITDSVYEHNALSQYVQYNNFSLDTEKGVVRVNGTLSDPLGKNLTKLAELEEAFRYFPGNKNDPDNKTKPYFYEINEFTSLQKTFNKVTGKFNSNFQLSFSLQEQKD